LNDFFVNNISKKSGLGLTFAAMANDTNKFQAIISHCKEYGFIFPSSEIYDGLQAVYDYGQMGSELKKYQRLLVEEYDAATGQYCRN
jgi:hypothetical protein